jgi:hypothetical protein
MEKSGRRRDVDLFNFSFLDILACVIGLLIFILTIVVVSGGGSKTAQAAGDVAAADRGLQDQRFAAKLASERRAKLQAMLNRRASDALDPVDAAHAVQGETDLLHHEADAMSAARLRAEQDLAAVRAELDRTERAGGIDPALVAAQAEAQQLDGESQRLRGQAAQIRGEKFKTTSVSYYIPHQRETSRTPVWMEIAGNKIWSLHSNSYEQLPQIDGGVLFRRLPDARAVRIDDQADIFRLEPLPGVEPALVVLTLAVRPDGYAAFRAFREQAWKRGYAVNWVPCGQDEPIILVHTHHAFEQ